MGEGEAEHIPSEVSSEEDESDDGGRRRAHPELRRGPPSEMSFDPESDDDDDYDVQPAVRRQPKPTSDKDKADVVATLLQQLTREPVEPAECAAKFSLYEGYASEVENMRSTLFNFHDESRPALPPTIVSEMDRRIHGIDCAEAMHSRPISRVVCLPHDAASRAQQQEYGQHLGRIR